VNHYILFDELEISVKVKEIAKQINKDYKDKNPLIICVLKGAVFFFSDLCKQINIPFQMDFIQVSSYVDTNSTNEVSWKKDTDIRITDRDVIIVEDIVDTGLTLFNVVHLFNLMKPKSLNICTMISKMERREYEIDISYKGFVIENGFVAGYGLDYNEDYRNLNDIIVLEESE